tara:strand:+ start:269841 stop:271352 length:1512 start_codon:yes stop_codon:yes gene_type:complete
LTKATVPVGRLLTDLDSDIHVPGLVRGHEQVQADEHTRADRHTQTHESASQPLQADLTNPDPPLAEQPLRLQRVDTGSVTSLPGEPSICESWPRPTAMTEPQDRVERPATPKKAPAKSKTPVRPDPVIQSLTLLLTMALMLAAARYAVPGIVEEVRYAWHRGELRAEYESGTEGLRNVSLDTLSQAYQMVTAAVGPSVVHIEVHRRSEDLGLQIASKLTRQSMQMSDQGSGVIVDAEGYVLTNDHVIADGTDITVTLSDGRRVSADVVGVDALTDLALLKVDADRLIPIAWGDSDRCKVGSPVWAVGSPFGLDRTVTFGILSGKHRMVHAKSLSHYQDFMQSDVAVNPGNSGGPLVDARGTLVGINTAIVGDTYQGVSFSIPSLVARQVYDRLRASGRVERAWLGVVLAEVADTQLIGEDPRVRGALINGLASDKSPAAVAGLMKHDHVIAVDDVSIRDMGHLMRVIGAADTGTTVQIDVVRDGQRLTLPVRLDSRPRELDLR